jgi:hypothetical protein
VLPGLQLATTEGVTDVPWQTVVAKERVILGLPFTVIGDDLIIV